MDTYGHRIVVDREFESALGALCRALREEGLQVLSRADVRSHLWQEVGHDMRRYVRIEAWSPDLALEALREDMTVGAVLPTGFAVYELADGETAVVAHQALVDWAVDPDWRRDWPALAEVVEREADRVTRVMTRLEHAPSTHHGLVTAA